MRRILTALATALIVAGLFPLTVLANVQGTAGTATTNEDTAVTVTIQGRDTTGAPITSFATTTPAHGTLGAPGAITCDPNPPKRCSEDLLYTPDANYNGTDTFNFTATNANGTSPAVAFTITITAVNDAPACTGDASSGAEDTQQNGSVTTCTDVDGNALTYAKVAGPSHGSATVNTNGTWSYTPAANYNGPDSFTFKANDGTLDSNTATMSLTVTPVNDAPVCVDDASSGPAGQQQSGTLTTCTDVDSGSLTYSKVAGPAHGSATVASDGTWTYDPTPGYNGADSFTFRANDGALNSNTSTMALTVTTSNAAPVCGADSSSGAEDTQQSGTLDTCTDADSDPLTYAKVAGPTHGTAAVVSDGTWTYTPAANYHGPDSFTFRANDGTANSNTATMTLTVTSVNDAPVCTGDTTSGAEDSQQSGSITTCSDVDGDTLTYAKVSGPSHGAATVNSNGSWTYTPAANYNGPDSFTFRANDGTTNSNTSTMSVTVTAVNDAPSCTDDASGGATDHQQTESITTCTDIDGDSLSYSRVADATHGTASVAADGSWSYTPDAGYFGTDSFTFKANDGALDSNTATIHLTVTLGEVAPVCAGDTGSGAEDTQQTGSVTCTDGNGDTLTYAKVSGPAHGTATVNSDGSWSYTPAANYNGPDSFTFKANDGVLDSNTATLNLTVTPVEDAPTCGADTSSGAEDNGQSGSLDTCTDVDGDDLTFTKVAGPSHGSASVASDGSWSYTPTANYHGPDSFTFKANDGTVDSNTATMSITVTSVNDAPTCADDASSAAEDTGQTGAITTCSDIEGDPLTYSKVSGPSHGSASVASDGSWSYTPAANYNGTDAFTFKANDGTDDSNTATIDLTVTAVNDAPVCSDLVRSTAAETPVSDTVSCTDAEGDTLTLRVATDPAKGVVNSFDTSTGDFTYTPNAGATGADSFTVIANDGSLDSAPATVAIGIANQAPSCNDPAASEGNEDTAQNGTLDCTDANGDNLGYFVVGQAAHGTASVDPVTGAWTYTPDANFNGTDSFTAHATDGVDPSNTVTIDLTIDPVNDAPVCGPATSSGLEETQQNGSVTCTDVEGDTLSYALATAPTKGIAVVDPASGSWSYLPNKDRTGADSFTVTANDGQLTSAPATVSLTIIDVNDPPIAKTDAPTVTATTTTSIPVTANDFSGPIFNGVTTEPTDTVTVTSTSGATKGSLSITNAGKNVTYDPIGCASGSDSFTYTITDSHGATASATVFVTIARPGQSGLSSNPITDAPALGFVRSSTMGSTTVPMRLSWCGVTATSASLRSYRVDQSTNGGSSYGTTLYGATTATSTTRSLGIGTSYRWRARETDTKSRTGSLRTSMVYKLGRYQDNSTSIKYTGTWKTHSTSSAWSGTEKYATSTSASAQITVTNVRAFAIVGPKSSSRGSFKVYVDGVLVATVSEKISSSTVQYRRELYDRALTSGTGVSHVIRIVPAGNGRIDLDAILTLSAS